LRGRRRGGSYADLKRRLSIFSDLIFDSSVEEGSPRRAPHRKRRPARSGGAVRRAVFVTWRLVVAAATERAGVRRSGATRSETRPRRRLAGRGPVHRESSRARRIHQLKAIERLRGRLSFFMSPSRKRATEAHAALPQTGHRSAPISKHSSQSRHRTVRYSGRWNVRAMCREPSSFMPMRRSGRPAGCATIIR